MKMEGPNIEEDQLADICMTGSPVEKIDDKDDEGHLLDVAKFSKSDDSADLVQEDDINLTASEIKALKSQQNFTKAQALQRCLKKMDLYSSIIPDLVLDHLLTSAGFQCKDKRVKRLIGLAAQKFISDIANDAYQFSKVSTGTGGSAASTNISGHAGRLKNDRNNAVLTIEDLSAALAEFGVNLKRPDFYR